jgi:hypothetical protein
MTQIDPTGQSPYPNCPLNRHPNQNRPLHTHHPKHKNAHTHTNITPNPKHIPKHTHPPPPTHPKHTHSPSPTAGRERGASLTFGASHVGLPSTTSKAMSPTAAPTKTSVCGVVVWCCFGLVFLWLGWFWGWLKGFGGDGGLVCVGGWVLGMCADR